MTIDEFNKLHDCDLEPEDWDMFLNDISVALGDVPNKQEQIDVILRNACIERMSRDLANEDLPRMWRTVAR